MIMSCAFTLSLLITQLAAVPTVEVSADGVLLQTDSFILGLGPDGKTTAFIDRSSGIDYHDSGAGIPFASILKGTERFPATAAAWEDDLLSIDFAGAQASATFRVSAGPQRLIFELASLTGDELAEIVFAQVPLTLKGDVSEPFGASPLALNLQTNCPQIPGLCATLTGFTAVQRFGLIGARGALVAAPTGEMRAALKDAISASPDLPHSPLGGPFALDAPITQGSYLIDSGGTLTEDNVAGWIDAARQVGATQIDLHGGHSFRHGDFEVNRDVYAHGRDGLKAVVDAIHEAGLAVGLHTYAFFIAKDTPWVTPVPDRRLASDATFTLASDLGLSDAVVVVDESTDAMSTVTGFHVRNSVTLRIDDELITYTGVSKEAPFSFTGCVRGAYGTTPAPHAKGATAYHLKECFGLFVPDGDSTLFTDVAQETANLYNDCGFDMLYLDALDASDVPAGGQYAWHYGAKFTYELARRIEKPAVIEMSTFSHHLWCVRSRMEAWDCPARSMKNFVDAHVIRNRQWQNAFLPTHLGWWAVFEGGAVQPERTFPDDMEYLCAKALATNSSLSYLVGFTPETLQHGNAKRLAGIAKRYEDLRSAGTVPESILSRLAELGKEYTLTTAADGTWEFRPIHYAKRKAILSDGTASLAIANPYGAQPLRLRIESLLIPEAYDSPQSQTLADFASVEAFAKRATKEGVTATLEATPTGALLSAQNTNVEPKRAWASFTQEFPTPINLNDRGIGVWVDGDGQGEVINVQIQSPMNLSGGFADRYIHVDFTGRRYFALVEPESDSLSDYEWAHTSLRTDWLQDPAKIMRFAYPMYHIWADYAKIGLMTVGVNNVPLGKSVQVRLETVKALPLTKGKLVNPSITLGGRTLTFPVELESGSYLEFLAMDDCKVYDARGECIATVTPTGDIPDVATGENAYTLQATTNHDGPGRAMVTVITTDEPLRP